MTESPEGRIKVHLSSGKGGEIETRIGSSRPLSAIRWFAGKSVLDTLKTLPMLYRVCGTAQSAAAVAAMEGAMGRTATEATSTGRQILVLTETLREHLLRIFIGWQPETPPAGIKLPLIMRLNSEAARLLFPEGDAFQPGLGKLHRDSASFDGWLTMVRELIADSVLGCSIESFLNLDSASAIAQWAAAANTPAGSLVNEILENGWATMGQSDMAALPVLASEELDDRLGNENADSFVASPDWQGRIFETGTFARTQDAPLVRLARDQWGNALMSRILARLVEVASLPDQMAQLHEGGTESLDLNRNSSPGEAGIGQVEAARGRLVHRVVLQGDRVTSYRMLAPTEWNFHPRGVVAQALNNLPAGPELERLAGLLIEAVDPCVGYDISIESKP